VRTTISRKRDSLIEIVLVYRILSSFMVKNILNVSVPTKLLGGTGDFDGKVFVWGFLYNYT